MTRARHTKPQLITIRPLSESITSTNVLGDASIDTSTIRSESFNVLASVTWTTNSFSNTLLGRQNQKRAVVILWKRDLLKPGKSDYEPGQNDIFEINGGGKLFVTGVEPTGHVAARLGNSAGGFQGWRITVSDRNPEQRAATTYDS